MRLRTFTPNDLLCQQEVETTTRAGFYGADPERELAGHPRPPRRRVDDEPIRP